MALAPVWASIWPILTTSCAAAGAATRASTASSNSALFIEALLSTLRDLVLGVVSESEALGDDLLHDLRCPGRDGPEPHVAEKALDRELPHVPVPAVHLHGLIRDAVRDLGGKELGHGDRGDAVLAGVVARRGVIDQMPRRLDVGCHVGDFVPERLFPAQRLAERLALSKVRHRVLA